MNKPVEVWAPKTPGAEPTKVAEFVAMSEAEAFAERFARPDLRYQDVRLVVGGKRVAFVGPAR